MNLERVATAFSVFFAGIAAIVATVLTVYLFTFLMDKLSCCNTAVLTEEEMEERRNATRATKQSGLAGLLKDERNKVYRVLFEKRSFPYQHAPTTFTSPQLAMTIHDETPKSMNDSPDSNKQEIDEIKQDANRVSVVNEADIEDGQAPTCSICLCEYDVGDKVILASACSHMFHFDCCMQWVDKGKEHCPYCRKDMITPVEFYETAIEVVGETRVNKLQKINQAATERLAALVASGGQTIASPVPPVGQTIHNNSVVEMAVIVVASPGTTGSPADPTVSTIPSDHHDAKDDTLQRPNDDAIVDLSCAQSRDPVVPEVTTQPGPDGTL